MPNKKQELNFGQGIDFRYNDESRMLKIRVRYTRVEVEADVVAATLRLMHPIQTAMFKTLGYIILLLVLCLLDKEN